jgi:asparagine synthase (glutamine-hydrolysing)
MINAFPLVLEKFDEPFADSSAIPTYIVSRETRRHVTVALSGDGGDELFAGYRMYLGEYWSRYYARLPGLIRQDLLPPLIRALPEARDNPKLEKIRRIKKFIRGMSTNFYERYTAWREVFDLSQREALLLTPPQKDLYQGLVRDVYYQEKNRFGEDNINLMLCMDLKGLLHADMLTKVDRMSMLHSLEVRVPFLDHKLVELAFNISSREKLRWNKGKVILLKAFQDLLPPALVNRPKAGFEIPIGVWLRKELKFLIHDFLDKDRIKKQGIFNYSPIHNLVSRHMKTIEDTSWHLWNLIVFQYWFRNYFE